MSLSPDDTTLDGFLGGQLRIRQPKDGYRAATDPVFLAAATDAKAGDTLLELGCGVGVASLCLAKRVPGVAITGIEVQAEYAALARDNAVSNGLDFTVIDGDIGQMPDALRSQSFDHVIANPPFFDKGAGSAPHNSGKATAHVFETDLSDWVDAGLRRLKPNGTFTMIQLAVQLPEILIALSGRAGNIEVLPLAARSGRAAKRVLVRAQKGSRAPFKLLAPFLVHSGAQHVQGTSDYSKPAAAILQDGAELRWENR